MCIVDFQYMSLKSLIDVLQPQISSVYTGRTGRMGVIVAHAKVQSCCMPAMLLLCYCSILWLHHNGVYFVLLLLYLLC